MFWSRFIALALLLMPPMEKAELEIEYLVMLYDSQKIDLAG